MPRHAGHLRQSSARRNAFSATLTGADRVTLVLAEMDLTLARRLTGRIRTDTATTVTLARPGRGCVAVAVDGEPARITRSLTVTLDAGEHTLAARRRACPRN